MRLRCLFLAACLAFHAPPATLAAAGDERLAALFDELQSLDKRREQRVSEIEASIWAIWYEHDDRAVRELMERGLEALAGQRHREAVDLFTRVVERAPGYAEAWNRRATTRYLMARYERALDDIERVLELEPRHFGALAGKGLCLRELGRPEAAIAAFRRALDVNPHLDGVYIEILRLRSRLDRPVPGPGEEESAAGGA